MFGARLARQDATGVTMLDPLPEHAHTVTSHSSPASTIVYGRDRWAAAQPQTQTQTQTQQQTQTQTQQQTQQQQQHCQDSEASSNKLAHTWLFETNSRTDGPCSCSTPP